MRLSAAALAFALALPVSSGCGDDDCVTNLRASTRYTGTLAGRFYSRTVVDGRPLSGSSGPASEDGGVSTAGSNSEACFADNVSAGYVEGWVDRDGDDITRCACTSGDCGVFDPSCQPEPGDPHGKKEFTLEGKLTTADLVFGDP